MLTARRITPLAPRLFALFLGTTVLIAASTGTTPTVEACPGPPPQPLRLLYTQSERIVVARAGESSVVQVTVDEDYKQTLVCTTFEVSSTLKGEGEEPLVYVYHSLWGEDTDVSGVFKEGDTLLLFLDRREEGHGYQVDNEEYGVKKLSEDDLKIYVKRIEELAEIMRQEKPDTAQITEWLVRCAEEPATRWDGVFELSNSHEALLASKAEKSSSEKDASESAEATDQPDGNETGEQVAEDYDGYYRTDPELARRLTDEQKNRLATALFSTQALTYTEYMIIDMVKDWNDARLAPFLLSQLRKPTDDVAPYYIAQWVNIVAGSLHNEALDDLAKKYSKAGDNTSESESARDESAGNEGGSREESEEAGSAADKPGEILQRFVAMAEGSLIG